MAAPNVSSVTIGANGTSVTIVFDIDVTRGAGYSDTDWNLDASGGATGLTYSSGDPGTSLVFTAGRTIDQSETATLDYTQPGDGIEQNVFPGDDLASFTGQAVTNNSTQDVTKPVLSSATVSNVLHTTADGAVDTDEGNGTLYAVVTTSSTKPFPAQVKAGNNHLGQTAVDSASQAVSGTGTQNISGGFSGLSPGTKYWAHFMHEDSSGNQSSVVSSSSFTTIANLGMLASLFAQQMFGDIL